MVHLPIPNPEYQSKIPSDYGVLRLAEESSFGPTQSCVQVKNLTQKLLTLDYPTMPALNDRRSGDGAEDLWGNESISEAETALAV
jgi:hypothetical protein